MIGVAAPVDRGPAVWAALLTLPLPGLGHVYARRFGLGVALLAVTYASGTAMLAATWMYAPTPAVLAAWFGLVAFSLIVVLACAAHAYRAKLAAPAERPRWFRSTWFVALVMLTANGLSNLAFGSGWRSFLIPSGSIIPTLLIGDRFMADVRRPGAMPELGDMVVFRLPSDGVTEYVKRVVAVGGQRVQLRRGVLFIDDVAVKLEKLADEEDGVGQPVQRLRETLPNGSSHDIYQRTNAGQANNTPEYEVPDGHFFVLGDNRDNSIDSRYRQVAYVPAANVVGRAETIFWSVQRSRILTRIR